MLLMNGKEIPFKKFPNGELKVCEEFFETQFRLAPFSGKFTIHFKFENNEDLIKLYVVKKFMDFKDFITDLLVYYMPYSRMDRSENGSAFTLKYIAGLINDLWFNEVMIIEPHSDVTMALIDRSKAYFVTEQMLIPILDIIKFGQEDVLFFPDAGAQKRYGKMFHANNLVGYKERDFETGEIKSLQVVGDVPTKPFKALIIDDLSSYGTTFIKSAEALKKLGATEVHLLVAHAENSIFHGSLLDEDSPIDRMFATDSILTEHDWPTNALKRKKLSIYELGEYYD